MAASVRSSSTGAEQGGPIIVQRPSGVQAGDLLIAIYFGDSGLSGVNSSGWTNTASRNADEMACRVLRKVATGGESSQYTFGQPINADGTMHVICVKDADTTSAPKVQFALNFAETLVTPSVSPASASHLEIRAGCTSSFPTAVTFTAPSNYQMRGTINAPAGFIASAAASRQLNSSTASGLKSFGVAPTGTRFGLGVSISIGSAVLGPVPDPPPPFTPGVGTSQYRYVFRDWGGTYLDDLELSNVRFDKRLLQAGTFSAQIAVPNRTVAQRVGRVIPRDQEGTGGITDLSIGPGVITCEIYRDGAIWGEYWITATKTGRSRGSTPTIQLRGSTMDAYLLHVELQELLEYVGDDQIDIARSLIQHMQGQLHASLNLVLQEGTSGVVRDHTYKPDEATYGQRLLELAQLDNGFEWTINHVLGAAGVERHWVWGYPTLGSAGVEHVFVDSPNGGDILDLDEELDALRGGTIWRARGGIDPAEAADASTTSTPLMSAPAEAAAHLSAGWPRLDRTLNYNSVIVQQTLDDYATYWAATAAGALRVDSVTVALGAEPSFTPNSLGDQARLYFNNEWHLPHSRVRRIIGIGITPTSKQSGKEEAQLIFEGLEVA
ncbi:hypothetical protein ACIBQX_11245 [Nonomuraea sp. NPDC049714]|uniref:hypothetical protein n=1 Tax=Nonomuraea sp. NPDC049714 TaxID=3364357 RepID=UPI0037A5FF2B